jgi:3-deoxy-manno-octulosonate cytidylyltransferase (CMP-KDO synthetase)
LGIVAIIPARFGSTRLPGKPLSDILGKTLIERVHERARLARLPDRLLVATEDERIAKAVRSFGGEAVMTKASHETGTDRIAEVASGLEARVLVNIQGDEPLLDPVMVDEAGAVLRDDTKAAMSTVAVPFDSAEEMLSPNVVKVVLDRAGNALYFSRSPIPHVRLAKGASAEDRAAEAISRGLALKHIGIYAYTRETVLALTGLPPSPLEGAEGLEQLRALQNGIPIRVVISKGRGGPSVDTPEDLEYVRRLIGGGDSRALPTDGRALVPERRAKEEGCTPATSS